MRVFFRNLIKNMDMFLFQKVDLLKKNYFYLKYVDFTNSLRYEVKVAVNQMISWSVIIVPIILVLVVLINNYVYRNNLNMKYEIFTLANKIIDSEKEIRAARRYVVSNFDATTTSDFEARIKDMVNTAGIKMNAVIVANTNSSTVHNRYTHISSDINFTNISVTELTKFITNVVIYQKLKVTGIMISKDTTTELLKGSINISHYNEIKKEER
ncbi:MAG: hypothetical protein HQK49_03495 [Oligoflexia bacterium]|nr:hypothetical protein [Oligoflexia bacterium]